MKYKLFEKEKPTVDGNYWYLSRGNTKPRMARWENSRDAFCGDADKFGPHTFCSPEKWAEIEYPS